jgi:hypothetical protein
VLPLHGIRVTLGRANRVLEALQAAGREGMRRLQTRRRPLVFLSATSLSQGDTLAVQVAVPPPRTPLGHIRNLLVDTLGGGLVEVRYADRAMAVHLKVSMSLIPASVCVQLSLGMLSCVHGAEKGTAPRADTHHAVGPSRSLSPGHSPQRRPP